ncbi:MAG: UDP-N-acetylmuramate dehydrogenase [Deltaproteobacteria bacterium]|nr:UDP-N-acetylmuramate dehydrogenase [Deltaproteobacteria bacterium]
MPTLKQVLLKDFAYYKTGGPADVLYQPQDAAELAAQLSEAQTTGLPLIVLGAGTNSLVMDEPFAGAVVVLTAVSDIKVVGDKIIAGAGVENTAIAKLALKHGLAGAAWMNRLPGQIGGTVRMNARCYGGEISQIATKVITVTRSGERREYADPKMFRGYKDTVFMENGDIIIGVELQLKAGDAKDIARVMRHCEDDRQSKGQFDFPSCGCVFKNDYTVGIPSGMLLAAAGAKGRRQGGAVVSHHHANFVYNQGASSRDILELTLAMRDLVYAEFGVWMSYEMEILGTLPKDLATALAIAKPQQLKAERLEPLKKRLAGR